MLTVRMAGEKEEVDGEGDKGKGSGPMVRVAEENGGGRQ